MNVAQMKFPISVHESWDRIDSSKIEDYMTCPRSYMFKHILGWRGEEPNVHLVFGRVVHKAQRRLLLNGYTSEAILIGWGEANEEYRISFPDVTGDKGRDPKVPGILPDVLTAYTVHYDDDNFKVLHTEVGGTVPLDDARKLYFKMDSILEDSRGFFSLEHKHTGKRDERWDHSWHLKFQIHCYLHVLYCMYPYRDVWGVIVNGIIIRKASPPDFVRITVRKTIPQMQAWLVEAIGWLDALEQDMIWLSEAKIDEPELRAFKRRLTGCSEYFGCQYREICSNVPNPLVYADQPPLGFKIEFWDPSQRELDTKIDVQSPKMVE